MRREQGSWRSEEGSGKATGRTIVDERFVRAENDSDNINIFLREVD